MRVARESVIALKNEALLDRVAQLRVELYGSLALTGRGYLPEVVH